MPVAELTIVMARGAVRGTEKNLNCRKSSLRIKTHVTSCSTGCRGKLVCCQSISRHQLRINPVIDKQPHIKPICWSLPEGILGGYELSAAGPVHKHWAALLIVLQHALQTGTNSASWRVDCEPAWTPAREPQQQKMCAPPQVQLCDPGTSVRAASEHWPSEEACFAYCPPQRAVIWRIPHQDDDCMISQCGWTEE